MAGGQNSRGGISACGWTSIDGNEAFIRSEIKRILLEMNDVMNDEAAVLQQLEIWKDKYSRLTEQYTSLFTKNQELEDRLINVVDKIERDKSLLSDEIDHLAEKVASATNTIDYMKNECSRYKSDCMLAVHLLQCQPSFYTSQHLNSLPAELRHALNLDTGDADGGLTEDRPPERKVVHFSTSAMTFPPTAVFLQSNEPSATETRSAEEDENKNEVRDVFLNKVRMAPEYQAEKLVQCPKCGFAIVKYERYTQTVSDSSYLSNSRSAPHLFALDGGREPKKRRSTTTSGDCLIDLSDEERLSPPAFPTSPLEGIDDAFQDSTSHRYQTRSHRQVGFTSTSPGVHIHRDVEGQLSTAGIGTKVDDLARSVQSQRMHPTANISVLGDVI